MARLTYRTGAVVEVSDEKAARLLSQGFTPVGETKKAPVKKAASPTSKK